MNRKLLLLLLLVATLALAGCSAQDLGGAISDAGNALGSAIAGSNTPEPDSDDIDDASGKDYEADATQLTEETVYSNEYLGLSFTAPGGWWVYDLSPENLSTTSGTTGDPLSLDIHEQDGYRYMYLGWLANLQYSTRNNHLSLSMYADRDESITDLSVYAADYEAYMLEPDEDAPPYKLVDSQQMEIGGRDFEVREFEIQQSGGSYHMLGFCCQLRDGYFLTLEVDFWPENQSARDTILSLVENNLSLS